jgi:hypothetical protein
MTPPQGRDAGLLRGRAACEKVHSDTPDGPHLGILKSGKAKDDMDRAPMNEVGGASALPGLSALHERRKAGT